MPVKGKKKAQARGSQGRRRPAQAPRPVIVPRRRAAWYRTGVGRAVLAIVAVALVGGVGAAVVGSRSSSRARAQAGEALDDYTGAVRGILQTLRPTATDMSSMAPTLSGAAAEKLADRAPVWIDSLERAQTRLSGVFAPPSAATAQQLFVQSVQLYTAAAKTFALAADVGADARRRLLQRAGDQRDQASGLWQTATSLLDGERRDAGLAPSNLTPPSLPAPAAPPPPASPRQGEGQGGGRQKTGQKKGGSNSGGGGDAGS